MNSFTRGREPWVRSSTISVCISHWLPSPVALSVEPQGTAGTGKVGISLISRLSSLRLTSLRCAIGWYADPYATGEASYLSVKGLQDAGVQATSKYVTPQQPPETFSHGLFPDTLSHTSRKHRETSISTRLLEAFRALPAPFSCPSQATSMTRRRMKRICGLSRRPSEQVPRASCLATTSSTVPMVLPIRMR